MQIIEDPNTFQDICFADRSAGLTTALVPTMGYFHDGHLSLMRWARENADRVYVSLFVNPTQFGPSEDLDAYPRDAERDARLAEEAGCDVLFTPASESMYPPGHATCVEVPELARHLCGASRPVHFKGVATVVAILLNLAMPTYAVFGEKDRQQLALVTRMARDLRMRTTIVGRPIVREADGLAMSSRNAYLSQAERENAPVIRAGLGLARDLAAKGETDAEAVKDAVARHYREAMPEAGIDYVEIVDGETMQPTDTVTPGAVAAVAVQLGKARLIDNIVLSPESP